MYREKAYTAVNSRMISASRESLIYY